MEYLCKKNLLTIMVVGDFDLSVCGSMREKIIDYIENRQVNRVIFNMRGSGFLDSSALGLILSIYKKTAPIGGGVAVKELAPHLLQYLEMAGLEHVISIDLGKEVHYD